MSSDPQTTIDRLLMFIRAIDASLNQTATLPADVEHARKCARAALESMNGNSPAWNQLRARIDQ